MLRAELEKLIAVVLAKVANELGLALGHEGTDANVLGQMVKQHPAMLVHSFRHY